MAVHRLGAGQATTIVLILPMVLLVVIVLVGLLFWTEGDLLFWTEGDALAGVFEVFSWDGEKRRKSE
jgi:hypothetical protein